MSADEITHTLQLKSRTGVLPPRAEARMHYYFDLRKGAHVRRDYMGVDLAGLKAAREQALQNARVVVCAELFQGAALDLAREFEVRDETGQIQFPVTFEVALATPRPANGASQPQ